MFSAAGLCKICRILIILLLSKQNFILKLANLFDYFFQTRLVVKVKVFFNID
jgi:hypothetical protein